jgi:hypothetical protein
MNTCCKTYSQERILVLEAKVREQDTVISQLCLLLQAYGAQLQAGGGHELPVIPELLALLQTQLQTQQSAKEAGLTQQWIGAPGQDGCVHAAESEQLSDQQQPHELQGLQ